MSFSDRPGASYWRFSTALGAVVAAIGAIVAAVLQEWPIAAYLAVLAVGGAVTVRAMVRRW